MTSSGGPPVVREQSEQTERRLRLLDTLLWFACSSALLLLIMPIGYVSGDTVPLAHRLVQGTWLWNPNRLLMEPTALLWLSLLTPLRLTLSVPDQLTLLSMLSGTFSVAVVRGWIVPRVATRRWVANFATAWFALGSAWAIVLLYGYPVMLQMPFLVVMAALLLRTAQGQSLPLLAFAGIAGGLAALTWISNALLVASVGLGIGFLAWRRAGPQVGAAAVGVFGGVSALALFLPLAVVWSQVVTTDLGFLSWLRSYGGGVEGRVAEGYGVELGVVAMGTAMLRAFYGAAMATVDLSPLVAWSRGAEIDGLRVGARITAFLMGAATLLVLVVGLVRRSTAWTSNRVAILVMMVAWVVGVVVFGFLWDNSDDKFYFQLAIPLAMAIATMDWWAGRKQLLVIVATMPLLFNAFDIMDRYVLFDREGKVSALDHAYEWAEVVLVPGYEDVAKLSYFVPHRGELRQSITWYADRYSPDEGIREIQRLLSESREACRRIVIVDIMARTAVGNPWTSLGATYGYGLANLQQTIAAELPGLQVREEAGFTFATWPGPEHEDCAPGVVRP